MTRTIRLAIACLSGALLVMGVVGKLLAPVQAQGQCFCTIGVCRLGLTKELARLREDREPLLWVLHLCRIVEVSAWPGDRLRAYEKQRKYCLSFHLCPPTLTLRGFGALATNTLRCVVLLSHFLFSTSAMVSAIAS